MTEFKKKKKTGLVLEGGGMRGIYTAGVLDVFLDHDISFDGVIGVSAGAVHGALCRDRRDAVSVIIKNTAMTSAL